MKLKSASGKPLTIPVAFRLEVNEHQKLINLAHQQKVKVSQLLKRIYQEGVAQIDHAQKEKS